MAIRTLGPDAYDELPPAQAHAGEDCALGDAPAVSDGAGR
jgi:hypothetical protein